MLSTAPGVSYSLLMRTTERPLVGVLHTLFFMLFLRVCACVMGFLSTMRDWDEPTLSGYGCALGGPFFSEPVKTLCFFSMW